MTTVRRPPRVIIAPRLRDKLEAHPAVTDARIDVATEISRTAASDTATSPAGGDARASHRVEVDLGSRPPRVAAVAGEDDAWHYVFQEFGGEGFRPPPAPLRRAAKQAAGTYRERTPHTRSMR